MATLVQRISDLASALGLDVKSLAARVAILESNSGGSGGSGGLETGTIGMFLSSDEEVGWLLTNGAEVSQSTYASLYAKLGYSYNRLTNTYINGRPQSQQWRDNYAQNSNLGAWAYGTSLPGALRSSQSIITKNRVYLLGGFDGSSYLATVYTASISSDGVIGAWATSASLPVALGLSQALVVGSRVYIFGGILSNGSSSSSVYSAPINSDGTLGAWTAGTSLPVGVSRSQAVVTKNRVYLLGGHDGVASSSVYSAPINSDGTLGAWTAGTSLPVAIFGSTAVVTHSTVFLLGGVIGGVASSNVYAAPINSDGTLGTWTQAGNIPLSIQYGHAAITNSRLHVFGGLNGAGTASKTVYSAKVNSDGRLDSWTIGGADMTTGLYTSQVVITSSRVYLLSGHDGANSLATTLYTSFSGGLNDYLTPHASYISATPSVGNFFIPEIYSSIAGAYLKIKT